MRKPGIPGALDKRYSRRNPRPKRPLRRLGARLAEQPARDVLALSHPIVVGAIGGSGTRVLRQCLVGAGVYMANHVNRSGDALDFSRFLNANLNAILTETRSVDYALQALPTALRGKVEKAFLRALRAHLADAPDGVRHWGFKVPRSIYILPLIQEILPAFRFVHLVRDGRDMALSGNEFQFTHHYRALAGEKAPDDMVLARLMMWSAVNEEARRWALREMGERYRIVRFEDLTAAPQATLGALFAWLGIEADTARLAGLVQPPASIGRRHALPEASASKLQAAAAPTLAVFGYG
jgi:sulfotransferase family protein